MGKTMNHNPTFNKAEYDKANKEIGMNYDERKNKAEAILEAIRKTDVGSEVIVHNEDGLIWCILREILKEFRLE